MKHHRDTICLFLPVTKGLRTVSHLLSLILLFSLLYSDLPSLTFFWESLPFLPNFSVQPPKNSDYFFHQNFIGAIAIAILIAIFGKQTSPQFIGTLFCKTDRSAIWFSTIVCHDLQFLQFIGHFLKARPKFP